MDFLKKGKSSGRSRDKGPIRRPTRLERREGHFVGRFEAMASPCELLVETDDQRKAQELLRTVAWEAWRIEAKFSRYRRDGALWAINSHPGAKTRVDEETARLLDFAQLCHGLSDGMFDVTSGVLRRVWKFDGTDKIPSAQQVEQVLPWVGWDKVTWESPFITLPEGMEIDLGGLGKEYAVDRAMAMAQEEAQVSMVVNFGGDMAVSGPRNDGQPWVVGVEDPSGEPGAIRTLKTTGGAMATSGDSRRFLLKDGVRYGHILNPHTGWPVEGAARSVTVAEATAARAGMLATFAILQGPGAEDFLTEQQVTHWVIR